MTNTTLSGNSAYDGGGMYNSYNIVKLDNCAFIGNSAVRNGGGMRIEAGSATVNNCTFSRNMGTRGAGLYGRYSNAIVTNCTFSGNTGFSSGGMYNYSSSPTVTNCIFWSNAQPQIGNNTQSSPTVTYSAVQGGYAGVGNIGGDPMFVDAAGGDLRLRLESPCIDAGDNTTPGLFAVLVDLAGNNRFVDVITVPDTGNGPPPIIDMGAFEAFNDCNENGMPDRRDIEDGTSRDCNANTIPDECDIADGALPDDNGNGVLDECEISADLDIKPGSCPNPLNPRSTGVLPMAILGTDSFDVTQIDLTTLTLRRADGVGGTVVPLSGPPGPGITTDDVATPFAGDLCDCHALDGDGMEDLSLKFSTAELIEALELGIFAPGVPVTLTISGWLLDGIPFEASDCVVFPGSRKPARPPARNARRQAGSVWLAPTSGRRMTLGTSDPSSKELACLQNCFNGVDHVAFDVGCETIDFDLDIDLRDFASFERLFSP